MWGQHYRGHHAGGRLVPCISFVEPQAALGTAFTYQGHLSDDGSPGNGAHDVRSELYEASKGGLPVGSTPIQQDVPVVDELFTAQTVGPPDYAPLVLSSSHSDGDGLLAWSAGDDGVHVDRVNDCGVYTTTRATHGFCTPAEIYSRGGCVGCIVMLIAQNGGEEPFWSPEM